MNKKNISIYGIMFIVLISLIYAYSLTTFSDGTSTKNITFSEAGSIYKNLTIPYWAVISKAEIDLKGVKPNLLYENNVVLPSNMNTVIRDDDYTFQTFSIGNVSHNHTFDISSVSLEMRKSGSPTSNLLVSLRLANSSNHQPLGDDLDNGTINSSSLISAGKQWYNISFNKTYVLLNNNTLYGILIKLPNDAGDNHVRLNKDAASSYLGGKEMLTLDGGATWASEKDLNFMIYGITNMTPSNLIIKTNNEITYHNTSIFNGTVTDIGLNTSSLQSCVDSVSGGNANCTLNFTSATPGSLEYSNLEIDYSVPLNITFKNEMDDTIIEGETFSIYLETTGFSQLYTNSNPFKVNLTTTGTYNAKVSSTNYPSREYVIEVLEAENDLILYFINSTDSDEITFNIVSSEGLAPLEDVFAVFTRLIGGTWTAIAEEYSDYAGQVKLDLDSNYEYTINFSKTNYETQIISLEPTESEYLIQMVSTIGAYNQSVHEGIRYRFEPSDTVLNNNTKYNFTFTLNSTVWGVTGCALYLKNGSILLDSTSSYTSSSCFLRIEQDTFNMTTITSEVVYQIGSTYNFTVSQQYSVIYTYEGDFSLKNFLDDLTDFSMAGFDSFGRMMLVLIVIFVITALVAQKISFTNPEVLTFLVIAQVWFFSYVNWLSLDFTPIPTIIGFDLKKYIIAILISLAGGAFVMRKFTD